MSYARNLVRRVAGLSAWNYTAEETAAILGTRRNGFGTSVLFVDGTRAFVPKGTASVVIRPVDVPTTESFRRVEFAAWPGLSDYIAIALQDLDYSNQDSDNPKDRAADAGTIWDIPAETFAKLRDDYREFCTQAGTDRDEWISERGAESFGSDFHMTRVGHGVGFRDRDASELGERLSCLCDKFRGLDLYTGDDGRTYC